IQILLEDTVVTMNLAHVDILRTVEDCLKLVVGHRRLSNGVHFSPIKVPI
ncbi:4226_t:CDS:2, partial [Funneliformis mosseae]